MTKAHQDTDDANVAASSRMDGDGPDAAVVASCGAAIALLERVRGWTDATYPGDTAASDTQSQAWELTHEAMAADVATLAGVRAQAALLLLHHECQTGGPEAPSIELPVLRNVVRLLAA